MSQEEYGAGRELVVKASGLAAGKGVLMPQSVEEAKEAVKEVMATGPHLWQRAGRWSKSTQSNLVYSISKDVHCACRTSLVFYRRGQTKPRPE